MQYQIPSYQHHNKPKDLAFCEFYPGTVQFNVKKSNLIENEAILKNNPILHNPITLGVKHCHMQY